MVIKNFTRDDNKQEMDGRAVHNYFDFDISVESKGETIKTITIHECNETDAEMWWSFNNRMRRDF